MTAIRWGWSYVRLELETGGEPEPDVFRDEREARARGRP
jgi:hypothetical protein